MKLSQRGRYGVLALQDLANEYGTGPVALKSIAERQDISENYLEQLMGTLKRQVLSKVFVELRAAIY